MIELMTLSNDYEYGVQTDMSNVIQNDASLKFMAYVRRDLCAKCLRSDKIKYLC